jgi:hypothetical protein
MSHGISAIVITRAALLSAGLLFGAASAASAANGYFDSAGAPLVAPSRHSIADSASTITRQQQSGYFADAAAPLVAPGTQNSRDDGATLHLQRASGYFADAGAPLVPPNLDQR